ncbi:MAG: flagellar biosynthesis anti-sigma factor FlgM [Eubacteriales bacterium]|nr:flagellar biosynthesis anti-sigma factor FlgM [Eubacteriales bacterium]
MRIDAYNAVSQIYQANSVSKVKSTAKTSSASDKFEISDTAKTYQTAKSAVNAASDVRMDKVNDIKARMAAGTYNVSSEDVADKILNSVSTLTF